MIDWLIDWQCDHHHWNISSVFGKSRIIVFEAAYMTKHCAFRDGLLEKLWVERRIFEPQEFFCVIKLLVWIFFRPQHEYFLGLIGVHEFFHLIFPCANTFFVLRPPPRPPDTFSNGPSRNSLALSVQILDNFYFIWNFWLLH